MSLLPPTILAPIVALGLLAWAPGSCALEDRFALAGTAQVIFSPVQHEGTLSGCTLVFKAIAPDSVYRNGKLVFLNGNITIYSGPKRDKWTFLLKLATADLPLEPLKLEPPYFAYLQSAHGTTSRSVIRSADGDSGSGSRLFSFQINEDTLPILFDIMDGHEIKIGFNREKDGMDVIVPLDLSISDTDVTAKGVVRKHSKNAVVSFRSCFSTIFKDAGKK